MLNGRNVGTRPRHKRGSTSLRHGLTGAFTLSRSLLPSGKRAYIAVKQQYVRQEKALCAPRVRRDDRPSCASTAVAAARRQRRRHRRRRRRRLAETIFLKAACFRIRDTFASSRATFVVYIASVIKEIYPFLPKERGEISFRERCASALFATPLHIPPPPHPPTCHFTPPTHFFSSSRKANARRTERDSAPEREQYFYKRREEKQKKRRRVRGRTCKSMRKWIALRASMMARDWRTRYGSLKCTSREHFCPSFLQMTELTYKRR